MYVSEQYWVNPMVDFPPPPFVHDLQQAAQNVLIPDDIKNCWLTYRNARQKITEAAVPRKAMLIGPLAQTQEVSQRLDPSLGLGVAVSTVMPKAIREGKLIIESSGDIHFHISSILAEKDWTLFINDAWILGTVHGQHDVIVYLSEFVTTQ